MSSSVDRRSFLKSALAALAAAPAATLAGNATAAEEAAAPPPPATPPAFPDLSICRDDAERDLLKRQWASALDLVKSIREFPLPAGSDPATTFAALPMDEAPAAPRATSTPTPATPATPPREGGR